MIPGMAKEKAIVVVLSDHGGFVLDVDGECLEEDVRMVGRLCDDVPFAQNAFPKEPGIWVFEGAPRGIAPSGDDDLGAHEYVGSWRRAAMFELVGFVQSGEPLFDTWRNATPRIIPGAGVQPDPVMRALIDGASEATDQFSDDELEEFVDEAHRKDWGDL